jgi:sarcosine oxidase subunit gamma
MTGPADLPCRSFVYRKLVALDANFAVLGNYAVARDYGDAAGEGETARRMGLVDLSPLPRVGFKGAGTAEWLAGQGIRVPEQPNRAVRQDSGVLAARLAAAELLLLGDLSGDPGPIGKLEQAWREAGVPPESPRGYPLPRRHTHFWFLVTGARAAEMFAKICGVDLRPGKFEAGCIAQTSIARMNTVAVRDDQGGVLAYHLLGDSASGAYLWDCLIDAMTEFDGAPVGLAALQAIAGKSSGGA